jgi:hypothetical protein
MKIDYLPDEMRANIDGRPLEGDEFTVGFSVGWRAACEAMQAKAHPQPAPDWRAACKIQMCDDGDWDVVSPCGKFWLADGSWGVYDKYLGPGEVGSFGCEISARAALSACPTPPPDAEVKP